MVAENPSVSGTSRTRTSRDTSRPLNLDEVEEALCDDLDSESDISGFESYDGDPEYINLSDSSSSSNSEDDDALVSFIYKSCRGR